jgi:hypothetical protein
MIPKNRKTDEDFRDVLPVSKECKELACKPP